MRKLKHIYILDFYPPIDTIRDGMEGELWATPKMAQIYFHEFVLSIVVVCYALIC